MNFEGMSAAEAAEKLMFAFADDRAIPECKEQILQAIQHFSNRNLVAARRYERLVKELRWCDTEWVNEAIDRAERDHA